MEHGRSASEMASRRTMLAAAAVGITGSVAGCMGGFEENHEDGDDESERTGDGTADTAGQDDTGENDGEDDTTGQQTDTFNPGWNPHDILSNNPDEWRVKGTIATAKARQNFAGTRGEPRDIDYTITYLLDISPEDLKGTLTYRQGGKWSEIGIFDENLTEEDFYEKVTGPESRIQDATIEDKEDIIIARGGEAEAAYTTDQNGRPAIITDENIENWEETINYMNSEEDRPINAKDFEDQSLRGNIAALEHITGAETYEVLTELMSKPRNRVVQLSMSRDGFNLLYDEGGDNIDTAQIDI